MRHAGLTRWGRLATRFATWTAPPYKAREYLARLNPQGYVDPDVTIYHGALRLGRHVFIGEAVTIFQDGDGGPVELGDFARVYGHALLETGQGGAITVGPDSRIHRGCHLISYKAPIRIGRDVGISQNCALYSYDHGIHPDSPISAQPLQSKGPITIDDHVWIGTGVTILSGVHVGAGAMIASGAVVVSDVPEGAIAAGVPARVVKMRKDLATS